MASRIPWRLVPRHMVSHGVRTALTIGGLTIAMFLFCFLISIITSLQAAVGQAASNRLMVQSKVSLFVDLPRDYQVRIQEIDGVQYTSTFQWFGASYKDSNVQFAQFGVDHDVFLDQYAGDMALVESLGGRGPNARAEVIQAFQSDRRAAVIGAGLARDLGWKVGDTVPLQSTIFHKADGGAWDFNIVGIYEPSRSNVDERTMWFRFDYLRETMDQAGEDIGAGCFAVNLEPGVTPELVAGEIDGLFENGPQATSTFTEAAFQAGFVSMMGNVPIFVGTIGGAVLFAILFSVINTMLMAARQRTREGGVLRALGFRQNVTTWLLLAESLAITLVGGGLGVTLSWLAVGPTRTALAGSVGNYTVEPRTLLLGVGVALGIGFVAGILPALISSRPSTAVALRGDG